MTGTAPARRTPGTGRLWFGVVAAPAAWTVAELAGYVLAARSCEPGWNGLDAYGVTNVRPWTAALVLALALIAATGLYVALENLRHTGGTPPRSEHARADSTGDPAAVWSRVRFMAIAGVLSSALFLLGTVLFGLPPLIVNACVQTR